MLRILTSCPDQKLPSSSAPTTVVGNEPPAPKMLTPATPAVATAGLDPEFATCKLAKAAGYGPCYHGKDPEYAWYRDSDHDGIDCE